MKSDKIFEAMEYIDDDLITVADEEKKPGRRPWKTVLIAAVSLAVIAGGVIGIAAAFRTEPAPGESVLPVPGESVLTDSETEETRNQRDHFSLSFIQVSTAVEDRKNTNVSTSGMFDAYESVTQENVVYIESSGFFHVMTDDVQYVDAGRIVPLHTVYMNMDSIMRDAEQMFPDKIVKYHIWFDNECAYGCTVTAEAVTRVVRYSAEEFRELRNASLLKLCDFFQIDAEYEQTITGETRVKSPEVYLTAEELEEICQSGIGYLFYALTPPDLDRMEKNRPDSVPEALAFLGGNYDNYYWTYYHRYGKVEFNEELFRHVRELPQNGEEYDQLDNLYRLMGEFTVVGPKLKYGEALYTTGTPDGEKWAQQLYESKMQQFGDLVDKYIVDGEFLKEELQADMEQIAARLQELYDSFFDGASYWSPAANQAGGE